MVWLQGCSAAEMRSLIFPKEGLYLSIEDTASLYPLSRHDRVISMSLPEKDREAEGRLSGELGYATDKEIGCKEMALTLKIQYLSS